MTDSQQRFAELRARYERSLSEKHAMAERAYRALRESPDERAILELQSIAHRLAGSAGSYGYEAIGAAAQALDAIVSEWERRAPHEREAARVLAERLAAPARTLVERLAGAAGSARDSR